MDRKVVQLYIASQFNTKPACTALLQVRQNHAHTLVQNTALPHFLVLFRGQRFPALSLQNLGHGMSLYRFCRPLLPAFFITLLVSASTKMNDTRPCKHPISRFHYFLLKLSGTAFTGYEGRVEPFKIFTAFCESNHTNPATDFGK